MRQVANSGNERPILDHLEVDPTALKRGTNPTVSGHSWLDQR